MNQYETALLLMFMAFYFPAFGLYQFMIFAINKQLPPDQRIPHTLFGGGWTRLRDEYKRLYPGSLVYQLTVTCALSTLLVGVAFVVFRLWEYWGGK